MPVVKRLMGCCVLINSLFLMFCRQKLRNRFRSITLYHALVCYVEFHTGSLAGSIYPFCSNSLLSVTWDWARYCASELTRNSPLTSFIGKHLTDLWLYTLEFQDSLSIPEVRETWERERALLPQAIFLRLPYWDRFSLPLTGIRSSSSWFWNCNTHSFFGSCWLGKNECFLEKCEKFLFCRKKGYYYYFFKDTVIAEFSFLAYF